MLSEHDQLIGVTQTEWCFQGKQHSMPNISTFNWVGLVRLEYTLCILTLKYNFSRLFPSWYICSFLAFLNWYMFLFCMYLKLFYFKVWLETSFHSNKPINSLSKRLFARIQPQQHPMGFSKTISCLLGVLDKLATQYMYMRDTLWL